MITLAAQMAKPNAHSRSGASATLRGCRVGNWTLAMPRTRSR